LVELVKLSEVIKKLNPSVEVDLEIKNSTLQIKNGKSEFSIVGILPPKQEAPSFVSSAPVSASFRIMSKKVLSLIKDSRN
jgi:hypothetical protein